MVSMIIAGEMNPSPKRTESSLKEVMMVPFPVPNPPLIKSLNSS